MLPGKAIAAAVVIFTAGVVSGGMAVQLFHAKNPSSTAAKPPPGGPPMPWVGQRVEFIRHVGDRLGLSPEQRERIEKHIKESQQRTRELWEVQAPQFKAEMTRVREQVEAELTPEQREKFAELQKQRPPGDRNSSRWRDPRRRGPGGEEAPGPGPGPDSSGRHFTNGPSGDPRPPAPAP